MSADLQELAQTNVAVVSAGAKSILDLGLTLEYLETHGVPVIGYQTNIFPAFYTSQSDFKVDYNIETPTQIARTLHNKWLMKLNGGVLIANPIPKEFEMNNQIIQKHALHLKGWGQKHVFQLCKGGILHFETRPLAIAECVLTAILLI